MPADAFYQPFARKHPHLPFIEIADALSANAPHLKDLQRLPCAFLIGSSGHPWLFVRAMQTAFEAGTRHASLTLQEADGVIASLSLAGRCLPQREQC